jgi:hypothetical protein
MARFNRSPEEKGCAMNNNPPKLIFSMTLSAPPVDKQEMIETSFLEFAARGPCDAEVIKGATEWTLRAVFTDPAHAVQFALCFPGGEAALVREAQRHERERYTCESPDCKIHDHFSCSDPCDEGLVPCTNPHCFLHGQEAQRCERERHN